MIDDYVRDTRKAHGTENLPEKHLQPDYLKDITREAAKQYDGESARAEKDIAARLIAAREETAAATMCRTGASCCGEP